MITDKFNVPLIVRVEGIWRPSMGLFEQEKSNGKSYPKIWIRFILNGKCFEEHSSRNWRSFDKTTNFSRLQHYAIAHNIHDMGIIISAHKANEREAKQQRLQEDGVPQVERLVVNLPRLRRGIILS